jgi:hypothetical protein
MSIKVSIEFIGLFLFVRVNAMRTRVLVPLSGQQHEHEEEHVLWLMPGPRDVSGYERLDWLDMDPIGRSGHGSKPLPKHVPNVTSIAKRKVRKELLQQNVTSAQLFARFTLEGGTFAAGETAQWKLGTETYCLTNAITWTGEHTHPSDPHPTTLTLAGRDMKTGTPRQIGPYAPDALRRVRLTVASLPLSEIGKPVTIPAPGEAAEHFRTYYSLFEPGNEVIPCFDAMACSSDGGTVAGTVAGEVQMSPMPAAPRGIMPVTCMVGGGDGDG